MDESGRLNVTIHDQEGETLTTAVLSTAPRGRSDRPGVARAEIRAPLWALSLDSTVTVRLPDGSRRTVRLREVTSMDGPVATVNVDLTDDGHRAARLRRPGARPTTRSSPA